VGFWAWFWIWCGLAAGALVVFGFIARSLFIRLEGVMHQLERILVHAEGLSAVMEAPADYVGPESNVLDNPDVLIAKRAQLLNDKAKKREARQRRLIRSLKNFNPDESRFH
jgi:hypothetical protein